MRKAMLVTAGILGSLLIPVQSAQAIDEINTERLRNAVTVSGILAHERAFQRIANNNGGTRASGTSGYRASVDYVKRQLRQAGYQVREQTFPFNFFQETAPAQLTQVSPTPTTYVTGTFEYSGSGDVTGPVVPIDLVLPATPEPSSTSGCELSDFPTDPAENSVALIQRGTCTFEQKVDNAEEAGYAAVIIFNEGQVGRTDLFIGTAGIPQTIPVVGLSYADGSALAATTGALVRVVTSTDSEVRDAYNVLADSPAGNADKTVVVGAHLDSVLEGPGINDNGSGSATILEIAKQMSRLGITPRQKLRFAFWGAEENGLVGSEYYVGSLSDAQQARIYANLNFDMVGSPNYVRFVYDGDGSDTGPAGPPGSAQIEQIFVEYFRSQGLESEPTEFSGRSDYGPFIAVGIPAGGLFTGAEGIKTEAQAAVYGGTAGVAYDPCYHQACDNIGTNNNLNTQALFEMGDAAAHATMTLARTRSGFFEDGSRVAASARAGVSTEQHGHVAVR